MTCRHCHVDAGPDRTDEIMDRATVDACLAALDRTARAHRRHHRRRARAESRLPVPRRRVRRAGQARDRPLQPHVLLLPKFRDLPEWLAERGVEMVALAAALPAAQHRRPARRRHVRAVDRGAAAAQRGGLRRRAIPERRAHPDEQPRRRVPAGDQAAMEREWKATLRARARRALRPAHRPQQHADLPLPRVARATRATSTRYMTRLVERLQPRDRGRPDVPQHDLDLVGRPRLRLRLQPDARDRVRPRTRPTSATSTSTRSAAPHPHRPALLRLHGRRRQFVRRRHHRVRPPTRAPPASPVIARAAATPLIRRDTVFRISSPVVASRRHAGRHPRMVVACGSRCSSSSSASS